MNSGEGVTNTGLTSHHKTTGVESTLPEKPLEKNKTEKSVQVQVHQDAKLQLRTPLVKIKKKKKYSDTPQGGSSSSHHLRAAGIKNVPPGPQRAPLRFMRWCLLKREVCVAFKAHDRG